MSAIKDFMEVTITVRLDGQKHALRRFFSPTLPYPVKQDEMALMMYEMIDKLPFGKTKEEMRGNGGDIPLAC